MTKKQYNHATGLFSTQIAIGSFVLGTLLLIAHLIRPTCELFNIGLFYILVAFLVNLIVLLKLCYLYVTQKNHQEYFAVKILILLSNLPIAVVYLKIVGETWI
jgi:hypothetical protein